MWPISRATSAGSAPASTARTPSSTSPCRSPWSGPSRPVSATSSPVIIQASRGARSYTNDRFLYHLMQAAVELYPEIPVALHQDHGNSPATCISAIEQGFTSVMMDGSLLDDGKTPADFAYNV